METEINKSLEPVDQAEVSCIAVPEESEACTKKNIAKRQCLLLLLAMSLAWGFLTGFLEEDSSFLVFLDYAAQIVSIFMVLIWCILDAEERTLTLTKKMSIAIILILAVAFPYYILTTRKRLEALGTLGLSILFAAFYVGLEFIGEYFGIFLYNLKNGY